MQAFDRLVAEFQPQFIRFANTYLHDTAVAEDLVADAFIYFWEKHTILPEDINAPAYILTVIKHKCLNHLQHLEIRERVTTHILSDAEWELTTRIATLEAFEPSEIFISEIKRIVNDTLATLSSQSQEIFTRSRFKNQSNKEIAQELGISIKTVEFHISRVIKKLRIELKDYILSLIL